MIIGEKQLATITKRTMLHTLSIIRDSIDLLNTLEKLLAVICLEFLRAFDRMDWNFIHMSQVGLTNIQSKIKINGLRSDCFTLIQEISSGFFTLNVVMYYCA